MEEKRKVKAQPGPLLRSISDAEIAAMDRYWRAANYLSVGQIYLLDNPLLKEPLTLEHIKPRLLGHWGTTPGLNFIYVHLNRVIKQYDLDMIYICGPGHGGPAMVANMLSRRHLQRGVSQCVAGYERDEAGCSDSFHSPAVSRAMSPRRRPARSMRAENWATQCRTRTGRLSTIPIWSWPVSSGDGEAETGPLAASWHSNKFLNPVTDGAVLPILHLNGYKIANPTVFARISHEELNSLFIGYGYKPYYVEGSDPDVMHPSMAATLDQAIAEIKAIQEQARSRRDDGNGALERPRWPIIILRTPKGWTGPKEVDGKQTEGSWRSHQVPMAEMASKPGHIKLLEAWMKSYKPEELFDENGTAEA